MALAGAQGRESTGETAGTSYGSQPHQGLSHLLGGQNSDVRITREPCLPRTVKVAACCPKAMQRGGVWRVEDFELHKQLYKGKASLLYSATCRQSQIPIALKLYRKARLSDLNWYQVEREIRIHAALQHENIIQLFAAFEDDQHVYMAQEYAAGGDLYEELKRSGGQLKERRTAREVLQPSLSALNYLHSKGIIHRDIKPENILLTAEKVVKLADFGLSIDATEERPVTRAGTLDYMAPEVLVCPEKSRPEENKEKMLLGYNAMVDAWAMGILAFELIVGHPPFEKDSRSATYEHIMYRKAQFPAWMTDEAKDFISLALTKAARKRPSIMDMAKHSWVHLHARRPSQCEGRSSLELDRPSQYFANLDSPTTRSPLGSPAGSHTSPQALTAARAQAAAAAAAAAAVLTAATPQKQIEQMSSLFAPASLSPKPTSPTANSHGTAQHSGGGSAALGSGAAHAVLTHSQSAVAIQPQQGVLSTTFMPRGADSAASSSTAQHGTAQQQPQEAAPDAAEAANGVSSVLQWAGSSVKQLFAGSGNSMKRLLVRKPSATPSDITSHAPSSAADMEVDPPSPMSRPDSQVMPRHAAQSAGSARSGRSARGSLDLSGQVARGEMGISVVSAPVRSPSPTSPAASPHAKAPKSAGPNRFLAAASPSGSPVSTSGGIKAYHGGAGQISPLRLSSSGGAAAGRTSPDTPPKRPSDTPAQPHRPASHSPFLQVQVPLESGPGSSPLSPDGKSSIFPGSPTTCSSPTRSSRFLGMGGSRRRAMGGSNSMFSGLGDSLKGEHFLTPSKASRAGSVESRSVDHALSTLHHVGSSPVLNQQPAPGQRSGGREVSRSVVLPSAAPAASEGSARSMKRGQSMGRSKLSLVEASSKSLTADKLSRPLAKLADREKAVGFLGARKDECEGSHSPNSVLHSHPSANEKELLASLSAPSTSKRMLSNSRSFTSSRAVLH
ncbi:hypothetical protein WJX72_001838 [[Myrmecia] bisecta]|uniref:Protein kinase domain-containing protein n=1 Tax=[Myrmecia] bisecta TaxID=41462 RepID=A0AAW1Q3G4_9CHLO